VKAGWCKNTLKQEMVFEALGALARTKIAIESAAVIPYDDFVAVNGIMTQSCK